MRDSTNTFLFTIFILIMLAAVAIGLSQTATVHPQIGPHQVYSWNSGWVGELNGTYHLVSDTYFEVTQPGQPPVQSKYQEPEVGKDKGSYVLDLDLKGSYQVTAKVSMYSLETGSATFSPTSGEVVGTILISVLLGLLFFALILLLAVAVM